MSSQDLVLLPDENDRLVNFCGQYDEHLRHLEKRLGITIANRGNHFQLSGHESILNSCGELMQALYALTEKEYITPEMVHLALQEAGIEVVLESESPVMAPVVIKTKHGLIKGRGANQKGYLQQIMSHDINFGIGPAGTGKTYLAVACAVQDSKADIRDIFVLCAGPKSAFIRRKCETLDVRSVSVDRSDFLHCVQVPNLNNPLVVSGYAYFGVAGQNNATYCPAAAFQSR